MNAEQRDELARLTRDYGGEWGINHTRRLLHLVEIIGEGLAYDREVVWAAAHLHDWGGYAPWLQPGVDHALRSGQVARKFLEQREFEQTWIETVVLCIETHHQGGRERPLEAQLVSDADALDFLGVIGILRDFAKKPKALREAYDTIQKRKAKLPAQLCLEKSFQIAKERVEEMERLLDRFEEESFGYF